MKLNRVLLIFLAIGIISSAIVTFKRMNIESYYKNYEVDFYYDELEKMAEQDEKSIDEILHQMKESGVHNLLIREETIQSMKQSSKYDLNTKLDGNDMIIQSPDEALIQRIFESYNDVKKDDRDVILEDKNTVRVEGKAYEQLTAPAPTINNYGQRSITIQSWEGSMLETVGLGYDISAIEKTKSHGYGAILVPVYNPDFQNPEKSIQKFFNIIDSEELDPSHIFFSGNYVLGYDPMYMKDVLEGKVHDEVKPIEMLANGLEDRNIAIGFIESSSQGAYLETEGLKLLAKIMEYEATGTYLTWDFIQTKYDFGLPGHHNGEEITNIFFRGITTRNIRLINLKPFILDNRYITDVQAYKNVLDNLEKRLAVHNVKPGRLQTLEYIQISNVYKLLTAIGILAAAFVIMDNLLRIRKKWLYILFGLSILPTALVYLKLAVLQDIFGKIFALKGAIVGPVIAIFVLIHFIKKQYKEDSETKNVNAYFKSIYVLILMTVICMMSVLFEVAMLADNRYFLGLEAFSGVKISQMVPILLVGVIYIFYYGYNRGYKTDEIGLRTDDLKRFLLDDIKIWQVLLVGVTVAGIMIFLRRSGNTSGNPSLMEALLRNVLELFFPARPRTKAIFIGIPALVLLIYNSYRGQLEKFVLPLVFVGSIALVNTVNTFSHMKAPIYLSMYRTGAEIIVGSLVAIVLILVQHLVLSLIKRKKEI